MKFVPSVERLAATGIGGGRASAAVNGTARTAGDVRQWNFPAYSQGILCDVCGEYFGTKEHFELKLQEFLFSASHSYHSLFNCRHVYSLLPMSKHDAMLRMLAWSHQGSFPFCALTSQFLKIFQSRDLTLLGNGRLCIFLILQPLQVSCKRLTGKTSAKFPSKASVVPFEKLSR
jgi:hypothetical protein